MDLKYAYKNRELRPFYAGTGAVATADQNGNFIAAPVLDSINILEFDGPNQKLYSTIDNDDEQEITALQLAPDASYLAYVSINQLLKIYNLKDKKITRSLKLSSPAYIMQIDSSSTLLAVGNTDGSVNVIDMNAGYITHSFKGHGATISALKFFTDDTSKKWLLLSGDTQGMVKIWDMVERKCISTVQEHTSAVRGIDMRIIGDDKYKIVTGGRDDIVNVYETNNIKKPKLIKTMPAHQQVESCGFVCNNDSNNHDLIYTAGGDAIFQIIDISNGSIIKKTKKPIEELYIIGVLTNSDASVAYLVYSDQTISRVDLIENLENTDTDIINIESSIAGNHGTIADMKVVGSKSNYLALATNSPTLRLIQVPDIADIADETSHKISVKVDLYEGHTDLLNSLDSTEDGRWLATASKDNTAILWRLNEETNKFSIYAKFEGHVATVSAIGLPNVINKGYPEFVITASNDLTIKKWSIPKPSKNGETEPYIIKSSEYTRRAHEKDINALSISPNDSIFATASYDKTCKIWDLESGELQATLSNHKRGLWDVAFCQYDKLLATASGDKTVKIWSLETFKVVKTLEGHSNAVQRCSFMNKQTQLVSSGADGLIKIWDCSTGECVKTLDGHANRIWALNVVDDGDLIISADADGIFQFWKDCTEENIEQDLEKEKLKIEQEQSLQNYISNEDWTNAFLLAMTLDHPMRLFNVLKQSLVGEELEIDNKPILFNKELDDVIGKLTDEQLLLLMKRCRDWNTNARTHLVSQRCIRCILLKHDITRLSEIQGMIKIIDSIIPYTQRHYDRVDNLIEQSYLLDYALMEMDKLF